MAPAMAPVIKLDPVSPDPEAIQRAAGIIRAGGLVAFPTETVYGLGAAATNEDAVRRLFEAKGRPADNPLIVHVSSRAMLNTTAAALDVHSEKLIRRLWPGPLTLVLARKAEIAPSVSAGLATVAVRMPANRIALDLLDTAGVPIAAPSANASGKPSPTRAEHVLADLGGRIDLLLDGGETRIGIESTVLDMTADPPTILRPGWITRETLEQIVGPVREGVSASHLRRSPGTLHRHYRPRARVILIESGPQSIAELCRLELKRGKVGLIAHSALEIDSDQFSLFRLRNSPDDYAHSIYSAMRQLDAWGADVIVIEAINERGEGAAVMDRLRRAASETITT